MLELEEEEERRGEQQRDADQLHGEEAERHERCDEREKAEYARDGQPRVEQLEDD